MVSELSPAQVRRPVPSGVKASDLANAISPGRTDRRLPFCTSQSSTLDASGDILITTSPLLCTLKSAREIARVRPSGENTRALMFSVALPSACNFSVCTVFPV